MVRLFLILFSTSVYAQTEVATYIRANYSKQVHRIEMRDGAELFTVSYTPNHGGPYPILMIRSPYRVDNEDLNDYRSRLGPTDNYAREGFIFVYQYVRGRYLSEGEFVNMRPHISNKRGTQVDENSDTYDTIEYLINHLKNHNGKVGLWGLSYPGFYTSAGVIDSHPALVAATPQAPIADWYWDDMHHHGAFALNLAFNFFGVFGVARPEPTMNYEAKFRHETSDAYRFFLELGALKNVNERYFNGEIDFWNKMAAHPNYDEFWQSRNILPHLKGVKAAVMTVGGLYDSEDLYGPWQTYRHIEKQNDGIQNTIVMGPWRHGGWLRGDGEYLGDTHFGFATAPWYREHVEMPFFKHHLKGGPNPNLPEALVFETGANRWRRFDAWPPQAKPQPLYVTADESLSFQAPTGDGDHDVFISDPRRPVPYTDEITSRWEYRYMAEDQRFASRRSDVLTYETEVLTDDLTIGGPIEVNFWVSTDQQDADWVIKLIDVQSDDYEVMLFDDRRHVMAGAELMIRGEIFRGRYRESYENPKPFESGEPTKVSFVMNDVLHTFKKGHKIMIQIQSSWFPFFDRNPQRWVDNIFEAEDSDFVKAEHRVYRNGKHATHIVLPVLQ